MENWEIKVLLKDSIADLETRAKILKNALAQMEGK